MRASLLMILAAFGLCFLATGDARADAKGEAKQHFAAGEARFKAGDYKAAITEFTAADALVPSPILSYNIALCHEKLGNDAEAAASFREYLKRRPDAQNRAAVESRIAEAEKRLAAKAPPKVEGPAAPVPAKPVGEGPSLPVPDAPKAEGPSAPAPSVDDALVQQLPGGSRAQTPPPSQPQVADLTPPRTQPEPSEAPALPEPGRPTSDKKAKPLYKEWWFWAVVGVSAIIVIDMMNDDSPSNEGNAKPAGLLFNF